MRIVVCIKQVYDPKTVRVSRSREELDVRDAARILNPADRYALEVALRLREAGGGEVVALTVGDAAADDVVREAVAMGADQAVLVTGVTVPAGSAVTRALAAAVTRLGAVDLVLTGSAGLVDGAGSLAPRLAVALGWPVLLDAVQIQAEASGLTALVAADGQGYLIPLATPAVVAILPGAERPRYLSPARIANAWNPGLVETWTAADLGLTADDLTPDTETGNLILGPERTRGQVIGGDLAEAAKTVVGLLRSRRVI